MNKVLVKTLVHSFYRRHAGLLWVTGFLAGGFMRESDHIALATYAASSGLVLAGYVLVWLLYSLMATRFVISTIRRYDVLLHLRLFSIVRRWGSLSVVQAMLMGPVLAYALFVGHLAWQQRQHWAVDVVVGALLAMGGGALAWYEYVLSHPNPISRWTVWMNQLRRHVTTPYGLFFLRHLFSEQAPLLWRTKVGTCLVWFGILNLYATDHYQFNLMRTPDYDLRLLGLGMLLVGLGHATLVYEQYRFEHLNLPLYRTMPIPDWRRWLRYAGTFALLLLPEGLLLLYHLPTDKPAYLSLGTWVFGLSLLSLQHGLLLRVHRPLNRTMTGLYIGLIAYFLLIMFRLPIWLLAGLNLTASAWLFQRYYWRSTWKASNE